jgi:UDP:flavonoid glycosyltransferase YjiC (YdhE family)
MHLPTAAFSNPYQPGSGRGVRRSWRLALPALRAGDSVLNRWRRETLGLPATSWRQDLRALRRLPHLLGYSPAILPRPDDWPANIHVTGPWFLDTPDYAPPVALTEFLERGPAIAMGFSSQVTRQPAAFVQTIERGLQQSGVRAVVLGGFGALARITASDRVLPMPSVPHDWLYPRVRAVIHHGGSGSTSGAVLAGVPNAAIAFGYDQPLWADRLQVVGVSPPVVPASALTPDGLASIIEALVSSSVMRERARQLQDIVSAEQGVANAVAIVSAALGGR